MVLKAHPCLVAQTEYTPTSSRTEKTKLLFLTARVSRDHTRNSLSGRVGFSSQMVLIRDRIVSSTRLLLRIQQMVFRIISYTVASLPIWAHGAISSLRALMCRTFVPAIKAWIFLLQPYCSELTGLDKLESGLEA